MNDKNISVVLLNALPDKKIKSLGNKGLIKIYKDINLIDYHIDFFNQLFKNPEIIIVGGFDSKRLYKYIKSKNSYKNKIKYIDHDIDDNTNIGQSIITALDSISNNNVLLHNCSVVLDKELISIIKKSTQSFILSQKSRGEIGCLSSDGLVINCFYDLSDKIYDSLFLLERDFKFIKQLSVEDINFHKLYMFEILNLCVAYGASIQLIYGKNTMFKTIENSDSIKSLQRLCKKLC
jgi:hypothetical protein